MSAWFIDPYTGHEYDLGPLFHYLHNANMPSPQSLARMCERSADELPWLIEPESTHLREMQYAHETFVNLKRIFRQVRRKGEGSGLANDAPESLP